MKVLHVISGLWKHTGGPAESVPNLCSELVKLNCDITLATLDGLLADTVIDCQNNGVQLKIFKPTLKNTIWYSNEFRKGIPKLAVKADIIHVHGLWEYPMWIGCRAANKFNKPLIITPRGSLEPVRLKKSFRKKKIAGFLFDNKNLKSAKCIHATAVSEKQSIIKYGLKNPVAVIPNGVNSSFLKTKGHSNLTEIFPECKNKRIALYMSRINPTKGLLNLARAWGKISKNYKNWHLLIAGPDERGHLRKVMKAFEENGTKGNVTFTGPLYDKDRAKAYQISELFILPTHNENFGIAIAEALVAGLPVITTHGAPWEGLIKYNCGWWVPVGSEFIEEALTKAMSMNSDDLQSMGFEGKEWVEREYKWDSIAAKMLEVYKWMLNDNKLPEFMI